MKNLIWNIFAPFRFLYKLYFGVVFFGTAIVFYPFFAIVLRNEKNRKLAYKGKRLWSRVICFLVFIFPAVDKKAQLPKGPYVICANHASYLDIVIMYIAIPDVFLFIGKAELLKWPIINVFFKNMDIPIERGHKKNASKSIEKAKEEIEKGFSIGIFPEGKIPEEGVPQMVQFKNGAFNLAISAGVPIVPVTFKTNWKLFSFHDDLFGYARPGIAKIIIHPIIDISNNSELEFVKEKTFKAIESELKDQYKV